MPALQVTHKSLPSIVMGSETLPRMRWTAWKMTSWLDWSFRIRTNSSPPNRDTVSESRTIGAQPLGHALQQLVAGAMTKAVVDKFEVVEIDEDQCDGTHRTLGEYRLFIRSYKRFRLGKPVSES